MIEPGTEQLSYQDLGALSESDLTMLIRPGLKISGFSTVEEADSLIKRLAEATFAPTLESHDYTYYDGSATSFKGTGAIDAIIRRRRGIKTKRPEVSSEIIDPIVLEVLPEDKSSLTKPENVLDPVINLRISGSLSTVNETLRALNGTYSIGSPVKDLVLDDIIMCFTRIKNQGPGTEAKPYIQINTAPVNPKVPIRTRAQESRTEDSIRRWKKAISKALMNPYSAGAFGQGKRS